MTYQLLRRNRHGIEYQDDVISTKYAGAYKVGTPLHYESTLDSGLADQAIDATPARINNAQFDGWRITQNDWHYALGQPADKVADGWIGFGGRQGQHWLLSRLSRIGYLYWPSREWVDIGGSPVYNRVNLSSQQSQWIDPIGGEAFNVAVETTWNGLWSTPGGGDVSAKWRVDGGQLKEDITLNEAGRNWIAANRGLPWVRAQLGVPTAAPADLWFGFVFQLDTIDIPRFVKNAIVQNIDGDFDDADDYPIELRDALDRLLAFMPLDYVTSGSKGRGNSLSRERLRKRFWLDGDGNHYLLVGVRLDQLGGMVAGDLVFDPTYTVGANNRDALWEAPYSAETYLSSSSAQWSTAYVGRDGGALEMGCQVQPATPQGATVDTAYAVITRESTDYSAGFTGDWFGYDVDTASVYTDASGTRVSDWHTRTTASVTDDGWANSATYQTPSLVSIVQEIVDRGSWAANNWLGITWRQDGGATDGWFNWTDYSDSAANAPDIVIEWTAGGALSVSPSDQVNASDTTAFSTLNFITLSDQLNISEAAAQSLLALITVADQLNVSDANTARLLNFITIADQLNISDSASISFAGALIIAITEQLDLVEVLSRLATNRIAVSDSVDLGESITINLATLSAISLAVSDILSVSEVASLLFSEYALRFYGNGTGNIDRARIPLGELTGTSWVTATSYSVDDVRLNDGRSYVATQAHTSSATDEPGTGADWEAFWDLRWFPANVGDADFTVEFWMQAAYADNDSAATGADARESNIVMDRDIWGDSKGHVLGVTRDGGGNLVFMFSLADGAWPSIVGSIDVGDNQPHHIALTRAITSGTCRIYVDGVLDVSGVLSAGLDISYDEGNNPAGQNNNYMVWGAEKHDAGPTYPSYNGYVDEIRISNFLVYTGAFTAPTRRLTAESGALVYHLDEASGTSAAVTTYLPASVRQSQAMELLVGGSPTGPTWEPSPMGLGLANPPGLFDQLSLLSWTSGMINLMVSDQIDLPQVTLFELFNFISTSSALAASETLNPNLISFINQSDALDTSDALSFLYLLAISQSDQLDISEAASADMLATIAIVDQFDLSEVIAKTITQIGVLAVMLYDQLNTSEALTPSLTSYIRPIEQLNISDLASLLAYMGLFDIAAVDQLNTSEALTPSLTSYIRPTEQLNISGLVSLLAYMGLLDISAVDQLNTSEIVAPRLTSYIQIDDTLLVSSEETLSFSLLLIAIVDLLSSSEAVSVSATAASTITFTLKTRRLSFTLKDRSLIFTVKRP